jgi:selenocysteine-specific elongation factor
VDRVFSIRGFGTIVTGTCISGHIRTGDEVQIYPGEKRARVRNVQAYHADVKEAGAGQRVALNLQGIEKQEIERGTIIGRPGSLLLTKRIDATLRYLKLPFKPIKNNMVLRFHVATTQVEARLILLDRQAIEPGQEAFVQFAFSDPIVVLPGDRFILRGSYAVQTLGGGTVLDIAPGKHKRQSDSLDGTYQLLRNGPLREKAEYHLEKGGYGGITRQRLSVLLGAHDEAGEKIVEALTEEGKVRGVGRLAIPAVRFDGYKQMIKSFLTDFHAKNPLKIGISREELRTRLPEVDQQVFQTALEEVVKEGGAETDKDRVKLPGVARMADESLERLEREIVAALEKSGLTPPLTGELADELRVKEGNLRDMLERLVYGGKVVKVKGDMYFSATRIEELKGTVRDALGQKKEMVPADFKAVLGLSRKYMIPLLEYLDEIKLTIRTGDKRILRGGV